MLIWERASDCTGHEVVHVYKWAVFFQRELERSLFLAYFHPLEINESVAYNVDHATSRVGRVGKRGHDHGPVPRKDPQREERKKTAPH